MWKERNPWHLSGAQVRPSGFLAAGRGFTVVELMITLGVAAIFASLALPSFVNMIRNSRLVTTAEMLQTDLLVARREAIKLNRRVLVCPAKANWVSGDLCGTDYTKWADGWVVCYVGSTNVCDTDVADTPTPTPNPILRRGKLDGSILLTGYTTAAGFKADGTSAISSRAVFTAQGNWTQADKWFSCVQQSGVIQLYRQDPKKKGPCE